VAPEYQANARTSGATTRTQSSALAAELRDQVPTSNFFQKEGYERNPVASRNNVAAKLLVATNEKMDKEVKLQGAKDLAAVFP
jgi:hypothetical protein